MTGGNPGCGRHDASHRGTALAPEPAAGAASRAASLDTLPASAEYRRTRGKPPPCPLTALHRSRVALVRRLPPAETIVDLGGACTGRPEGALVAMGYPHPFRTLTNVEPPSEERHAIYRDVCDD